jgi:hypothetical protein
MKVMSEKYSASQEKDKNNFWWGVAFLGAFVIGAEVLFEL